jgi:hypothetical protein
MPHSRHNLRTQRKGEFQLAKTMMVMVLVFLVTNFARVILGIQEVLEYPKAEWCYDQGIYYNPSKIIYLMDFMARFLLILNSSVNFLIYCMVGSKFRNKLFETLSLRRPHRRQSSEMLTTRLRSVAA